MNVYPYKPLTARWSAHAHPERWTFVAVTDCRGTYITDAEFAEHFYEAELLDTLIAAVEAEVGEHKTEADRLGNVGCNCQVCFAFRAFREQVTAR